MMKFFTADETPEAVPWSVMVQGFGEPEQYEARSGSLTSTRKVKLPLYGTIIGAGVATYAPPFIEYIAVVEAFGIVG